MAITRGTEGLVIADDFDRTASSTVGGGWTERSGDWEIASNRLSITSGSTSYAENDTGSMGEMFLQSLHRATANISNGLMARFNWNGGSINGYLVQHIYGSNSYQINRALNGSFSVVAGPESVTLNHDTDYPSQIYVADGVQEAWLNGVTTSGTNTDHDAENSRGVGERHGAGGGSPSTGVDDFIWCTSKNIVVTGLSSGQKAKILNSGDSVVATATESGGTATIDASRFGGATEICPVAGWAKLVVTDSSDVTLDTYDTTGVYPGDEYSWDGIGTNQTPTITNPTEGEFFSRSDSPLSLALTAPSDTDFDEHEWDYSDDDGSSWTSIASLSASTTHDWDVSALTVGDYLVRARSHDGTQYGDYDEVGFTLYDQASPYGLPDVFAHLDATEITGLSDTDAVSSWPDESGWGNDAEEDTGSIQPAYRTNQINSLPVVRFTSDELTATLAEAKTQPCYLWIVEKVIDGTRTGCFFVGGKGSNAPGIGSPTVLGRDISAFAGTELDSGINYATGGDEDIWLVIFNGASSEIWRNGTLMASGDAGSTGLDGFTLGRRPVQSGSTNPYFNDLLLGEVIWGSGVPTTDQQDTAGEALATKWGITTNWEAPATAPDAPTVTTSNEFNDRADIAITYSHPDDEDQTGARFWVEQASDSEVVFPSDGSSHYETSTASEFAGITATGLPRGVSLVAKAQTASGTGGDQVWSDTGTSASFLISERVGRKRFAGVTIWVEPPGSGAAGEAV